LPTVLAMDTTGMLSIDSFDLKLILFRFVSTSAWMESVIKKKQKKKGNTSQTVPENMDMFEELNRYLRKPRLRRAECPNPSKQLYC